jgi:hypothetical protein
MVNQNEIRVYFIKDKQGLQMRVKKPWIFFLSMVNLKTLSNKVLHFEQDDETGGLELPPGPVEMADLICLVDQTN